ncbi:rod-binding protein [Vibrio parahaemolyticus]|uniref:rod-binding protein n=1 Tax=Vibrio mediterranei TaxID=689 RepID=UPI0040693BD7
MNIDAMNDTTQMNSVLYHDNAALTNIKHSSDQQGALQEVAGQFEAMFLQMVLRQMRSSSDVLADEDSPFSSQQHGVFRDMHDGQLAIEMAKKQSSGIADMLVKQLGPAQSTSSNLEVQFDPAITNAMQPANDMEPLSQVRTQAIAEPLESVNSQTQSVAFYRQSPKEVATTMAFSQSLIRTTEL